MKELALFGRVLLQIVIYMVMVFVSVIILSFFYGLLGRLSNHTVVATPLVLAGLWFAGFLVAAIPFVYLRKYKAKQED